MGGYTYNMEVWQQQTNDMLDRALDYAEDWPAMIDMLSEAEVTGDRRVLHDYLEYLTSRLRLMRRRFNWVHESRQPHGPTTCSIYNYTYKMYEYMTRRYQDKLVVTPNRIVIEWDQLTEADREKFRAQL